MIEAIVGYLIQGYIDKDFSRRLKLLVEMILIWMSEWTIVELYTLA